MYFIENYFSIFETGKNTQPHIVYTVFKICLGSCIDSFD